MGEAEEPVNVTIPDEDIKVMVKRTITWEYEYSPASNGEDGVTTPEKVYEEEMDMDLAYVFELFMDGIHDDDVKMDVEVSVSHHASGTLINGRKDNVKV